MLAITITITIISCSPNRHHSSGISIILAIIQSTWSCPFPFFQLSNTIMVTSNRPNVWISVDTSALDISFCGSTYRLFEHACKQKKWSNMHNFYLSSATTIFIYILFSQEVVQNQARNRSQESIGCISNDSSRITSRLPTRRCAINAASSLNPTVIRLDF